MNPRQSFHIVGIFLKFFGLLLLIPAVVAFYYRHGDLHVFLVTIIITSGSGLILELGTKKGEASFEISRKDAFFIAFMCWITASLFGALPYLILGVFETPFDAIFESVSGYTTTGATVLSDIESQPRGILFYRSFTQWLGGMGIIVLAIAVLPKLSVGGMQLMSMETPGPHAEKLTPHVQHTAKHLWLIYLGLSAALTALLFVSGMPLYESVTTTFSTVSTGGFSVRDASIGAYGSPLIESIVIVFMILGGTNFLLLYFFFTGSFSRPFKSTEFKFYLLLLLIFIVVVSVDLRVYVFGEFSEAFRLSAFQVVAIMTGTGFTTANFAEWTHFATFALLVLMFVGGCAGSTTGSVKVFRILVLIKKGIREVNQLIMPHAILPLRIDKTAVNELTVTSVTSFFLLYMAVFIFSVFVILSVDEITFIGALSACAATLGNVGPGFEEVGASKNYQFFNGFSKMWLCFLMLLGRLELYTILVFLSPMFWKR